MNPSGGVGGSKTTFSSGLRSSKKEVSMLDALAWGVKEREWNEREKEKGLVGLGKKKDKEGVGERRVRKTREERAGAAAVVVAMDK